MIEFYSKCSFQSGNWWSLQPGCCKFELCTTNLTKKRDESYVIDVELYTGVLPYSFRLGLLAQRKRSQAKPGIVEGDSEMLCIEHVPRSIIRA
jgi:hypothetical protein